MSWLDESHWRRRITTSDCGAATSEPARPANFYRLSMAYQAKGDSARRRVVQKAADFNSLPQLNYAFIRMKAQKMAGGKA